MYVSVAAGDKPLGVRVVVRPRTLSIRDDYVSREFICVQFHHDSYGHGEVSLLLSERWVNHMSGVTL